MRDGKGKRGNRKRAGWAVSKKTAKKNIKRTFKGGTKAPKKGVRSNSNKSKGTFKSKGMKFIPKDSKGQERPFYTKEDIFVSRLASIMQIPKEKVKLLFSQRAESVIRINPLAGAPDRIKNVLEREGLELQPIEWIENTYIVLNKDKSELGQMPEYTKGLFYIQGISSMIPAVVLDPQPGEKILDMCAAPGSKTSQIAAMVDEDAEIVASDDNFARAKKLEDVLRQFHVKNVEIKIMDARRHGGLTPMYYDKILLDAPCSGEGLIYMKAKNPLKFWTIRKSKIMALLQRDLIESAWKALKNGGTLIYSTCTLEPAENEGIVTYLLKRHQNARVEDIKIVTKKEFGEFKGHIRPGITEWSGNEYDVDCEKCVRVMPGKKMQPFFIAKIRKI